MASFTREHMDWVWGSLKPWQILHSKLAERERNGNARLNDVWELVNQTLGADTTPSNSIERGEEEAHHKWSQGIRFLADDGEFWRHGGVMESRVREWLSKREEELQDQQISNSTSAHHLHHDPHHCTTLVHYYNTEMGIARSTLPALEYHNIGGPIESDQQLMRTVGADQLHHHTSVEDHENRCFRELDQSQILAEEEEEDAGLNSGDDENESAELLERGYNHDAINASICFSYEDNEVYNGIRQEGECELVINGCCSSRSAAEAAAYCEDGDHDQVQGSAARLAGEMAAGPKMEEEMEVCAVCLEQLNDEEEEGGEEAEMMMRSVQQALACRHVFHRACIEPWLERQPHACCPCCRAPISSANLARPALHLAGPLYLGASSPSMACAGHHHNQEEAYQRDIMGLLADMEAALEHFGFRS